MRPEYPSDFKAVDEVVGGGYRRTRPFAFDVEPGEEWLDLGAMIGAFSAYAESKGAKRVIAVEPDPEHIRVLRMNSDATVAAGAVVTDDRTMITLNRNDKRGNTWRNSVMREWQGGSKIDVPAYHIKGLFEQFKDEVCVKMDIEGMEMPILEWLLAHPAQMKRIKKLVFEWSFDVDADLGRFRKVMHALMDEFPNVAPSKLYEGTAEWPSSWFPACTTIFCKR